MNEKIPQRLREAAEAHRPDRERMLARVQRGAAGPAVRHRARPLARPRAALVGLVTAGILATGGLAIAGIAHTSPSSGPVTKHATPLPTVPAPSETPSAAVTSTGTSTSAGASTSAVRSAPPTHPRPTPTTVDQVQNGPLWSVGSVDRRSSVFWEQNDVIFRTTQPLTSLTVELRIALTGNVQNTGNWRTLPSEYFTVIVQETGGSLVYRWVLKPGLTVPAGQHEFAAQYNHATGVRSAAGDSYHIDAHGPAGPASVWGGFVPTR